MRIIAGEFVYTIVSVETIQEVTYHNIPALASLKHWVCNERLQPPYLPIINKPQNDLLTGRKQINPAIDIQT